MGARVFISHRPGDAAALATALAAELDAMFGDDQVVRIEADVASNARWREALAGAPGGASGVARAMRMGVSPGVPARASRQRAFEAASASMRTT